MLELRGLLAVRGDGGPLVGPGAVAPDAEVDHGLDGEDVARLHDARGLVLRVVGDVRRRVEQLADAVAAVRAHDGAVRGLGDALDGAADVAVHGARPDQVRAGHEALERGLDQVVVLVRALADDERLVEVAVVAAVVDGDVDVDDVALLEGPQVGDAVADDLVHGRADGAGEVVVVERRRVASVLDGRLVGHAVDLRRRHAQADGAARGVEHLAADLADLADARDILRAVDADRAVPLLHLLARRLARLRVVRPRDGRRQPPQARRRVVLRVRPGPQVARVVRVAPEAVRRPLRLLGVEGRRDVDGRRPGLVALLVRAPVRLEAVLGAKIDDAEAAAVEARGLLLLELHALRAGHLRLRTTSGADVDGRGGLALRGRLGGVECRRRHATLSPVRRAPLTLLLLKRDDGAPLACVTCRPRRRRRSCSRRSTAGR